MWLLREFTIRRFERGMLYRDGDFVRFLAPGAYRLLDPRRRYDVERFDLSHPAFEHRLADFLVRWYPEEIDALFVTVTTGPTEVAVIFENGRPTDVLGPDRRALFWKGVVRVRAQVFDLACGVAAPAPLAAALVALGKPEIGRALLVREVPEAHVGLLYLDGAQCAALAPGRHAFWTLGPRVAVDVVDTRVKALAGASCEVVTKDRRVLRIGFGATWRIADAARVARTTESPVELLYKEIDRALANLVAEATLEACVAGRRELERAALAAARDALAAAGIELLGVGIRDLAAARPFEHLLGRIGQLALYAGPAAELEDVARLRI